MENDFDSGPNEETALKSNNNKKTNVIDKELILIKALYCETQNVMEMGGKIK